MLAHKETGNKLFGEKKFEEAYEAYGAAIAAGTEAGETTALAPVFSNRAACQTQLHNYAQAETDATSAIAADPSFAKGLFRRAFAREQMGKQQEAIDDSEAGLLLGPNPEFDALLERTLKVLAKREGKDFNKSELVKRAGRRFLLAKSREDGVHTLPSGMLFQVLKKGNGLKGPNVGDQCSVHYKGTLINNEQFDSSIDRGKPSNFAPNQVIKGWTEALQLMTEGDKWRVFIPYNLAYGSRGAGGDIPPYSALIFEMELIKIFETKPSLLSTTQIFCISVVLLAAWYYKMVYSQ